MDIQRNQMEGDSGVIRSIIDELHSSYIQRNQMESESGVNRRIIDELYSWDIQGDQMERESGVSRSIIDEFILRIPQEIKGKVKVMLLEVSLMKFIVGIS